MYSGVVAGGGGGGGGWGLGGWGAGDPDPQPPSTPHPWAKMIGAVILEGGGWVGLVPIKHSDFSVS